MSSSQAAAAKEGAARMSPAGTESRCKKEIYTYEAEYQLCECVDVGRAVG